MKETVKPSSALEGKFRIIGVVPGLINVPYYGNVDLRTISLEMAEKLFAAGCPYLKRVPEKRVQSARSAKK